MMDSPPKKVFLIEIGNTKSLKFHDVFSQAGESRSFEIIHVISKQELTKALHAKNPPTSFVFHWNYTATPHVMLELICQNPVFSKSPLVLYVGECTGEDVQFWQEYRVPYVVRSTPNLVRDSLEIFKFIEEDFAGESRLAKFAQDMRLFFNAIQNDELELAEGHFKKMTPSLSQLEAWYFGAHLLKAKKSFKLALQLLSNALNQAHEQAKGLEPRFLHLIGTVYFKSKDIEKALKFLSAAHRISPLNPRRKLILGQIYTRMGNFEKARSCYLDLLDQSQDYDSVYIPLLEHLTHQPIDDKSLELIPKLIGKLSERKLTSMTRRLKLKAHERYEDLIDIFKNEFYHHVQKLLDKDDFYGAVSLLQFLRNAFRPSDTNRKFEVTLQIISALIQSEDYKLATKHLTKLKPLSESIQIPSLTERFVKLEDIVLKKLRK